LPLPGLGLWRRQAGGGLILWLVGDLLRFSPSPTPRRTCRRLQCHWSPENFPVLVILGNHDHGGAGSLWQEGLFQGGASPAGSQPAGSADRQPFALADLGLAVA